jgi:hypothetical protein
MGALKGKKQSPEHVALRVAAIRKAREANPWKGGRPAVTAENFWDRVIRKGPDDCWLWTGCVNKGKRSMKPQYQYGRLDAFGVQGAYAHRVAYYIYKEGDFNLRKTAGSVLRHTCDNPLCCNPAHLVPGTHEDNMRDMVERGRSAWHDTPSTSTPRAKLTADDVRSIRKQSAEGVTRDALAKQFNVSIQTIKAVRSGRHYKDVS